LESLKKCQIFLEKQQQQQQQQQQQALWKWYHEQIRDHMELLAKQIKIEVSFSLSVSNRYNTQAHTHSKDELFSHCDMKCIIVFEE
jgi:NADH dehydrogenase/NADH:ubiquinone oxidoreductase subunit G